MISNQGKKQTQWPFDEGDYLLVILMGVFCLSLFIIKQYGPSYDEPLMYRFADINTEAYTHLFTGEPFDDSLHFYNLEYYGTGYLVLANPIVRLVTTLNPFLENYQGWHLINFSFFLFSVWIVFKLCLKFASKKASFIAALLYLTQPLLWGHGVMNPKDAAFLAAFVTAVYTGMQISDHTTGNFPELWSKIHQFLEVMAKKIQTWMKVVLGIIFILLILDRIYNNFLTTPMASAWYAAGSGYYGHTFLNMIISAVDPEVGYFSFENYLQTALRSINRFEFVIILVVALVFLLYGLIRNKGKYAPAFLAGIILGIASSIRILGPAALFIVAAYFLVKWTRISLPIILCYLLTALLTTYFLWPYLWAAPLTRLQNTLEIMINFPWNGDVRFEGASLNTLELPWYYLPKLIGIQFTLPVVCLAAVGIGISAWKYIKNHPEKRKDFAYRLIPFLWFSVPVVGVMIFQPPLYDTFRQFLFITPPLFIFSAVSIDHLVPLVKKKIVSIVLCVSIILPGIIAMIWLHPYEYIYYNILVGWTGNIGRNFDNDYWGTSFCEDAGYIMDQTSDTDTRIVFNDGILRMGFNLCTGDQFDTINDLETYSTHDPDYSVTWSRYDHDTYYNTDLPLAYVVRRGSTIFSVVRGEP